MTDSSTNDSRDSNSSPFLLAFSRRQPVHYIHDELLLCAVWMTAPQHTLPDGLCVFVLRQRWTGEEEDPFCKHA